jgi:hypothetical protein
VVGDDRLELPVRATSGGAILRGATGPGVRPVAFHVVVVWKGTCCLRSWRRIASRPTVVIFSLVSTSDETDEIYQGQRFMLSH